MEEIISKLEELSKTNESQDIIAELMRFQSIICSKVFENIEHEQRQNQFQRLLAVFLVLANNQNSSVRLTTCSTITTFLMKVNPYYPRNLRKSFTEVTNVFDLDSSSSSIIVAIFAFITNFIAPQYLHDFLDSTPIFHHFFQISALSSERLASIITNITWLGDDWFTTVFAAFIQQALKQCSRNTLCALLSLFNRSPKTLLRVLLQFGDEGNWQSTYISILAFMISGTATSIIEKTIRCFEEKDFEKAQQGAFLLLQQETSKAIKDDCFIILSKFKKGLSITPLDDDIFIFKLNDNEFKFNTKEYQNQDPKFYYLPLPLDMLIPDSEKDYPSVIQAKLETIGSLCLECTERDDKIFQFVIDILDKESAKNPTNSSLLLSISNCANTILSFTDENETKFSDILYRCLFCDDISWFHATEILKTIMSIDRRLYKKAFGYNGESLVRRRILTFAMNSNDNLSNTAINSLVTLSNYYFNEITSEIWLDTNFFDNRSLFIHLKMMNKVLLNNEEMKDKKKDISHLIGFSKSLYELSPKEQFEDLELLSQIFLLQSFFENNNAKYAPLQQMIDAATAVIQSALEILTGIHKKNFNIQKQKLNKALFELTSDFLSKHEIEITDVGAADFKKQYFPIYACTKFILSLPLGFIDRAFTLNICRRLFKFFPEIITDFILKEGEEITESERTNLCNKLVRSLMSISSVHIHAQWAEISLFPLSQSKLSKTYAKEIGNDCLYFIVNFNEVQDPNDLYSFLAFLASNPEKYGKYCKHFLRNIPLEMIHIFVELSKTKYTGLVNTFSEEFTIFNSLLSKKTKHEKLYDIMHKPLEERTQEEIDFSLKYLHDAHLLILKKEIRDIQNKDKKLTVEDQIINAFNTRQRNQVNMILENSIVNSLWNESSQKIKFDNIKVPNFCIDLFIDYLNKTGEQKEAILSILNQYDINDYVNDNIQAYLIVYDQENSIRKICEKDGQIKKKDIKFLIKSLLITKDFTYFKMLFDNILNLDIQYESKPKLSLIIQLISIYLQQTKEIDLLFIEKVFDFIKKHESNIDIHAVSQLLYIFSLFYNFRKEQNEQNENQENGDTDTMYNKLNEAYDSLIETNMMNCAKFSRDYTNLFISFLISLRKRNIVNKEFDPKDVLAIFLRQNTPSLIIQCIDIFDFSLTYLSPDEIINIFKSNIDTLITTSFKLFRKVEPVITHLVNALTKSLQNPNLRVLQAILLNVYMETFRRDESAEMFSYFTVCKEIIKICGQFTQLFVDICQISNDYNMSISYKCMGVSNEIQSNMYARYADPQKREQDILERTLSWLDNKKDFDSYFIDSFYEAWRNLLVIYARQEELANIIVMQYMKHIKRFYVFLLMIQRTINDLKAKNEESSNEFKQVVQDYIPMISTENHQKSVQELLKGNMKLALDLSFQ